MSVGQLVRKMLANFINGSGEVTDVSPSNPLPVDASVGGTVDVDVTTATIEQTTGAAHNGLNISAGGVETSDSTVQPLPIKEETLPVTLMNSLVPDVYDYISLSYTGDNLTGVVFKTGGSGGTTQATLILAYTGSVLDTVTKS